MSIFDKVVDLFKYAPVEHYNFILMGDEQKEKDISYND